MNVILSEITAVDFLSKCCIAIKTVMLCHNCHKFHNTRFELVCSVCFPEPVVKPSVIQPRNKTLHVKPGKL